MSGSSGAARNNVWEIASADGCTARQIHYAEFAQLCGEVSQASQEAADLIKQYQDLCQEQQQNAFLTGREDRQQDISLSKQDMIGALLNNVRMQTHKLQELKHLQASRESYAQELEMMEAVLSEAEDLYEDPDVEAYVDFVFASDTPRAGSAVDMQTQAEEQAGERQVEEAPHEPDTCIICLEDVPPHTTPRPLSENTRIVILPCCRQVACRECLETFWDKDNDNKIGCPVCRKVIGG